MLTEEQQKTYIEAGGGYCPYCLGSEVEYGFFERWDEGEDLRVQCGECGRYWTEEYLLVMVGVIEAQGLEDDGEEDDSERD